jgi:hypothetical protein
MHLDFAIVKLELALQDGVVETPFENGALFPADELVVRVDRLLGQDQGNCRMHPGDAILDHLVLPGTGRAAKKHPAADRRSRQGVLPVEVQVEVGVEGHLPVLVDQALGKWRITFRGPGDANLFQNNVS